MTVWSSFGYKKGCTLVIVFRRKAWYSLKEKNAKKYGDDSNVDYNIVIAKNDHIGDSLGVYDVLLKDGENM